MIYFTGSLSPLSLNRSLLHMVLWFCNTFSIYVKGFTGSVYAEGKCKCSSVGSGWLRSSAVTLQWKTDSVHREWTAQKDKECVSSRQCRQTPVKSRQLKYVSICVIRCMYYYNFYNRLSLIIYSLNTLSITCQGNILLKGWEWCTIPKYPAKRG